MEGIRQIRMGLDEVSVMGTDAVKGIGMERAGMLYPCQGSYLELVNGKVLKVHQIHFTVRGGEYLRMGYEFRLVLPGRTLRLGKPFYMGVEKWIDQINRGMIERSNVAINARGEVERASSRMRKV